MKKILLIGALFQVIFSANSQEITDALRYAQTNQTGTARFRAMSGAFGAVGGDMSAIMVNPAGSVVFSNNLVAITGSNYNTANTSNYFGTINKQSNSAFDVNQAGGVFVFENNKPESNWKKFALGLNYENMANFSDNQFMSGTNAQNSAIQYFANSANGYKKSELDKLLYDQFDFRGQQASLAYQAFLINPVNNTDSNTLYLPNIAATGNFYQENEYATAGYNGKFAFNASTQYKDKFYFGLNLNSHFTDFRKTTSFYEDYVGATGADNNIGIQSFRFNNELYTYGAGFSFQLGTIYKVNEKIRLGLAYQSPTWMRLNDELTQSLSSVCADCLQSNYNINPGITNVYAPYRLQTPSKVTGSFAYVFGKKGLISFDYATKNYENTEFTSTGFETLNNDLNTNLKRTNEFRIGVEQRLKQWSLRSGYRFEESPYKDTNVMGDLTGYSAGLGYNFGATKLDLAYAYSKRNTSEQFFSQGMTDRSVTNAVNNIVTITLGFEL